MDAGLDVVTDGEGRRENMYYFFQKRLEGLSFAEMEYRKFGPLGFGIEIAKVVSRLGNPHFELTRDWRVARDAAIAHVEVNSPALDRTCLPSCRIMHEPTCTRLIAT